MSKRDAKIYLEAARKVAEGETNFACWAIDKRTYYEDYSGAVVNRFAEMFRPDTYNGMHLPWFGYGGDSIATHYRVIALCLAAAMAEAGDL